MTRLCTYCVPIIIIIIIFYSARKPWDFSKNGENQLQGSASPMRFFYLLVNSKTLKSASLLSVSWNGVTMKI